jgi:hypothetical protein
MKIREITEACWKGYKRKPGTKEFAPGSCINKEDRVSEGGWGDVKTQNTVLHPRVVSVALQVIDRFVEQFNAWLEPHGLGPVRRGRPTGSTAYHEQDTIDDPEKIYGDIDLQMVGPETERQSQGQFALSWNQLSDEFMSTGLNYIAPGTHPGNPTVQIGDNDFVKVDFMWHPERLEKWGAARVTPERGVKGLLFGNMYSVFGELLDMSIQHAGVQLKVIDDQHVPFSKQKDTQTVTVTTAPETFILDVFNYEAKLLGVKQPKIDPMLRQFAGNDLEDVKIFKLVNGVRGFAQSCEDNNMFGRGDLQPWDTATDFLRDFWRRYEEKAMTDVNSKKRDKAATPQAIARANSDREKVLQGLEMVRGYFR